MEVSDKMLVLITYDVNTETPQGRRRLNKIAKKCVEFGQRVQNSVFECLLDPAQYKELEAELVMMMDVQKDSLRFYNLGEKYATKIEHFGIKGTYDPQGLLVL